MKCSLESSWGFIYLIQLICAALSIFGCFLIFLTYYRISNLQVYYFRIIVYISISDALRCIVYFFPASILKNKIACTILGVLNSIFELNATLWSLLISIIIYQVVINSVLNFDKYEKVFKVINLILVPILSILPVFTNSYGLDNYICTYISTPSGNIWRYSLILIPGALFNLISILAYIKVYKKVQNLKLQLETSTLLERVVLYPVVMIMIIFGIILLRSLQLFKLLNTCSEFIIYTITESLFSLQGFLNSSIFFLTPSVRKSIKSQLQKPEYEKKISLVRHESQTTVFFDEND